jgi:hypothetical protein
MGTRGKGSAIWEKTAIRAVIKAADSMGRTPARDKGFFRPSGVDKLFMFLPGSYQDECILPFTHKEVNAMPEPQLRLDGLAGISFPFLSSDRPSAYQVIRAAFHLKG